MSVNNVASKASVDLSSDGDAIDTILKKQTIALHICIGSYSFDQVGSMLRLVNDCRNMIPSASGK